MTTKKTETAASANGSKFELSSTDAINIDSYIKSAIEDSTLECEAVLKKEDMDNKIFNKIYSMFSTNKYEKIHEGQILDIIIDTKGDKSSSYRVHIESKEEISAYCKLNRLDGLTYTVDKKERLHYKPIVLSDYNFNINIKREINHEDLGKYEIEEIVGHINNPTNDKKFRMKQRFSFAKKNSPFQIDLTVVKQNDPKNLPTGRSLVKSGALGHSERFEVEVEFRITDEIRNKHASSKNNTKIIHDLRDEFLSIIGNIVILTNDSHVLKKKSEHDIIRKEYIQMMYSDQLSTGKVTYQNIMANTPSYFVGLKPGTLTKAHMVESELTQNILTNYTVTDKADGEKILMYVNDNRDVYLLDSRLNVKSTGLRMVTPNCLIEGEYVSTNLANVTQKFLIFDIWMYDGKKVYDKVLTSSTFNDEIKKVKTSVRNVRGKDRKNSKKISNVVGKSDVPPTEEEEHQMETLMEKLNDEEAALDDLDEDQKEFEKMVMKTGNGGNNKLMTRVQKGGKLNPELYTVSYDNTRNYYMHLFKNEFKKMNPDSYLDVDVKKFLMNNAPRKEEIHSKNKEILSQVQNYAYNNDGLIFTPLNPVTGVKDKQIKIFKWKPEHMNTVDFILRKMSESDGFILWQLCVGYDLNSNIDPLTHIYSNKSSRTYRNKTNYVLMGFGMTKIKTGGDGNCHCEENNEIIYHDMVVECRYDKTATDDMKWKPMRIRHDKIEKYKKSGKPDGTANDYNTTVKSIMETIHNPITNEMITGLKAVKRDDIMDDDYYVETSQDTNSQLSYNMRSFNNQYAKKPLYDLFKGKNYTLFEIGSGRGGDMHKWKDIFRNVVGTDVAKNNVYSGNKKIGSAYERLSTQLDKFSRSQILYYVLNFKKDITRMMEEDDFEELKNITNDLTLIEDQAVLRKQQILNRNVNFTNNYFVDLTFGKLPRDNYMNDEFSSLQSYNGIMKTGFDVVACQFAVHYFFESNDMVELFCKNVNSILKPGGYFIGTAYHGHLIEEAFDKVNQVTPFAPSVEDEEIEASKTTSATKTKAKSKAKSKSKKVAGTVTQPKVEGIIEDTPIWMLEKKYTGSLDHKDPTKNTGKTIDVYIHTIGKQMTEFLFDIELLKQKFERYGIKLLSEDEVDKLQETQNNSGLNEELTKRKKIKHIKETTFKYDFRDILKQIDNKIINDNGDEIEIDPKLREYIEFGTRFVFYKEK
jgi:hypothetical protein